MKQRTRDTGSPLPPDTPERWRAREVRRLRARLERDAFPRLEMALLVGFTALVGLLASAGLRLAGWTTMGWRYLAAFALAYAVFLSLLRVWQRLRVDANVPDAWHGGGGGETFSGGGGHGGGAGASGTFEASAPDAVDAGDAIANLPDVPVDGDGCLLPLLALALAAAILAALFTVVSVAPTLFAELALDGLLAAGLYRRLQRAPEGSWLETALRRTALPFGLAALLVVGSGFALQALAPAATTLGEAISLLRTP